MTCKNLTKPQVSSKPSTGVENTCIWQESINGKDSYSVDNSSLASIEELDGRKDGLPAGACDGKDLLLSTTDCLCELKQFSVIPGSLFPTYTTGGLSMTFLPRHCPSSAF